MQTVLVTGGAGYLGSILCPTLLSRGFKVRVVDSFMFHQSSLMDCCADPNFEVIKGDVRDEKTISGALKGADIVIPLAALVGAPLCKLDPLATQTINQNAIEMLIHLANKDQKILYPTTNSGYGIGEAGKFCTEESPLRPISLYGETKVASEKAILERGNSITFRLATVFGASPRMRIDLLVNEFVYRALKDRALVIFEGHFKRNFIHIRDVSRAFLHGIDNFEKMKDEPYNVGLSEANLSKLELCAEIQKQLPQFVYLEAPIGEDPDKRDYIVSNEKLESTGYKPAHSLQMGIRELITTYTILNNTRFGNV
jgi:nucleoside-diphosphate-sugar epimerase